uniref:Uncharacterized protein n=1 Tax=Oryza punctata TaxID=4537 RepID=A0A0E0M750_ORYPU
MAATAGDASAAAFWTACPHCCYVHSYPRHYAGLRLRCPTAACRRAFSAAELPSAPPIVPGTDMYFCTWAFFPLGPPAAASAAEGWTPFTPFNPAPTPSPPPATATPAAAAPTRAGGPTSRRKMCVSLKGRARVEAEQQEEEAAAATVDLEPEVQEEGIGEKGFTGINLNETVELSELGFRDDEIELFTAMS